MTYLDQLNLLFQARRAINLVNINYIVKDLKRKFDLTLGLMI